MSDRLVPLPRASTTTTRSTMTPTSPSVHTSSKNISPILPTTTSPSNKSALIGGSVCGSGGLVFLVVVSVIVVCKKRRSIAANPTDQIGRSEDGSLEDEGISYDSEHYSFRILRANPRASTKSKSPLNTSHAFNPRDQIQLTYSAIEATGTTIVSTIQSVAWPHRREQGEYQPPSYIISRTNNSPEKDHSGLTTTGLFMKHRREYGMTSSIDIFSKSNVTPVVQSRKKATTDNKNELHRLKESRSVCRQLRHKDSTATTPSVTEQLYGGGSRVAKALVHYDVHSVLWELTPSFAAGPTPHLASPPANNNTESEAVGGELEGYIRTQQGDLVQSCPYFLNKLEGEPVRIPSSMTRTTASTYGLHGGGKLASLTAAALLPWTARRPPACNTFHIDQGTGYYRQYFAGFDSVGRKSSLPGTTRPSQINQSEGDLLPHAERGQMSNSQLSNRVKEAEQDCAQLERELSAERELRMSRDQESDMLRRANDCLRKEKEAIAAQVTQFSEWFFDSVN